VDLNRHRLSAFYRGRVFYVTAVPPPDRELHPAEVNRLLNVFRPIASEFPNNIQVEAVSASPDAGGYGAQFMLVFHAAGLTVNGVVPTDNLAEDARIIYRGKLWWASSIACDKVSKGISRSRLQLSTYRLARGWIRRFCICC
jgi:hypothetical protein